MSFSVILGAGEAGLIFAIMSLGIYITFNILNFPDLTVDGSFTLGCVISGVCTFNGYPILGVLLATLAGLLAGFITGFLHTKMKVQYILAGILTMTGLYSINLKIGGGKPYLSLFDKDTIFSKFASLLKMETYSTIILIAIIVVITTIALYIFFKTQAGMAIRATGDNETMVRASSINTDAMKICGLALANALVALSASIYAQYQLFYDITQGIGMMVVGLTSIILGTSIFGKRNILNSFLSLIIGAILYRFVLTFALSIGMDPNDWKLMCATLVAIVICLPTIQSYFKRRSSRYAKD